MTVYELCCFLAVHPDDMEVSIAGYSRGVAGCVEATSPKQVIAADDGSYVFIDVEFSDLVPRREVIPDA